MRGRQLGGEFLGTALLLFIVVGSGIAAERLSADGAVQLVVHAVAVGAGLGALISLFAPVSGAHFNPSVTLGLTWTGEAERSAAVPYVVVQLLGAFLGVVAANLTFGEAAIAISETDRTGFGQAGSEFVGTFVLVLLIIGLVRTGRTSMVPAAVGAWVAAIIIGTSSTGFANPAVTIARMFTDTYTGIAPASVPAFLAAQVLAAVTAGICGMLLFRTPVTTESAHQRKESP